MPGRPFFICTGTTQTSSAPASPEHPASVCDDLRRYVIQVGLQFHHLFDPTRAAMDDGVVVNRGTGVTRRRLGPSSSFIDPAPWPTFVRRIGGRALRQLRAARSAMPPLVW